MLDKVIENNRVCIIGEIVSEFTFSHEVFGEGFYIANVSVNRLSDMVDVIPLMISERLIDVTKDYRGMKIEVAGQFRSYNRHEGTKNKLVLSIFVRELRFIEKMRCQRSSLSLTRYSLMVSYANHQFIERLHWEERLQMY